jgi:hypothetical protein
VAVINMLDHVIELVRSGLNYKSDIPVFLIFALVFIFGFASIVPRLFIPVFFSAFAIFILSLPGFYLAPTLTKTFSQMGLIGQQWLRDEDMERSVGLGIMIGIILTILFLYEIVSVILELVKKTNPVYIVKTKRREPTYVQYMKVPQSSITKYLALDNNISEKLNPADITYIRNSFADEKLVKVAMAWVLLGLPVRRAVKKTVLDNTNEPISV